MAADGSNPQRSVRKGAGDAVIAWVSEGVGAIPSDLRPTVEKIARAGGTPLVVAERKGSAPPQVLGVIYLKDIVKSGMRERFDELRHMGIRTVMITGDNPLTAAAIAEEAGVDDFLAQATPETKMKLIREAAKRWTSGGDDRRWDQRRAGAGAGGCRRRDEHGTQAAKEAGNMVDLDSNPTKLIEIVEVGKQLLITRGALTTFSIANDVAKYFAIIPAVFVIAYPQLEQLNIMQLATPQSAILSAVIFNALIIVALIPLGAARGQVPPHRRRTAATAKPADLRRRRDHPAVYRHQGDRPDPDRAQSDPLGPRIKAT